MSKVYLICVESIVLGHLFTAMIILNLWLIMVSIIFKQLAMILSSYQFASFGATNAANQNVPEETNAYQFWREQSETVHLLIGNDQFLYVRR